MFAIGQNKSYSSSNGINWDLIQAITNRTQMDLGNINNTDSDICYDNSTQIYYLLINKSGFS